MRFEETFGLSVKGYSASEVTFAKALTANMMGGIGYFYGPSIIDRHFRYEYDMDDDDEDEDDAGGSSRQPKPELTQPYELYTATPSRSFFPRGFYWSVHISHYATRRLMLTLVLRDEGFHLMLIGAWDNDLR
jgi:mannosyl-oligosaccharide glucosidase